jgi:hypothetical protein
MSFTDNLFFNLHNNNVDSIINLQNKEEELLSMYISCLYDITETKLSDVDNKYCWKIKDDIYFNDLYNRISKYDCHISIITNIIKIYQTAQESANKLQNRFYNGKIMIINSSGKHHNHVELTDPTNEQFIDALWIIKGDNVSNQSETYQYASSVINNERLIIQCFFHNLK